MCIFVDSSDAWWFWCMADHLKFLVFKKLLFYNYIKLYIYLFIIIYVFFLHLLNGVHIISIIKHIFLHWWFWWMDIHQIHLVHFQRTAFLQVYILKGVTL